MQIALFVVVAILTAAAWTLTWSSAQNMGLLMKMGVPMSLGMEGWAGFASFLIFTSMWLVMMVAMMLPSTYPVLLLHRTLSRNRPNARASTFVFAAAYFLTWTSAGVVCYGAYTAIGAIHSM